LPASPSIAEGRIHRHYRDVINISFVVPFFATLASSSMEELSSGGVGADASAIDASSFVGLSIFCPGRVPVLTTMVRNAVLTTLIWSIASYGDKYIVIRIRSIPSCRCHNANTAC